MLRPPFRWGSGNSLRRRRWSDGLIRQRDARARYDARNTINNWLFPAAWTRQLREVNPPGIDQSALGTPNVAQNQTLIPTGIISREEVVEPIIGGGNPARFYDITMGVVSPLGIQTAGSQTLVVAAVAPTATPGTPAVAVGAAVVVPGGIADTGGLGTPVLAAPVTLVATGIADTGGLGTPVVAAVARPVPTAIGPVAAVGTPVLQGVARVVPGGVATAGVAPSPNLTASATVSPGAVAPTAALGTPVVVQGSNIVVGGIDGSAIGTPVIVTGPVTTIPGGIADTGGLGTPVVAPVTRPIPTAIAPTSATGTPVVATSARPIPTAIAPTSAAGTPAIVLVTRITPSGIADDGGSGTPALSATVTLTPAGFDGSAIGTPAIAVSGITLSLPGVARTGGAGLPNVRPVYPLNFASIPDGSGVGTPVTRQNARIIPDGISTAEAVPVPFIIGPQRLEVAGIFDSAVGTPFVIGPQFLVPPGIGRGVAEYWGVLV